MSRSIETGRAIEASAAYVDDTPTRRREHPNPAVRAMLAEHPQWTQPPSNDDKLVWRFCVAEAECGIGAQNYESGGGSHGGSPDDKVVGRLVHDPAFSHDVNAPLPVFLMGTRLAGRRSVGLPGDGRRGMPAAQLRIVDGHLAALTHAQRVVLQRAYGPERANRDVTSKLGQWWFVAIHLEVAARAFDSHREALAKRYDGVRGIAAACHVDEKAMGEIVAMENYLAASAPTQAALEARFRWFLHEAGSERLEEVRAVAEAAVWDAWNSYADVRGRRRVFARG